MCYEAHVHVSCSASYMRLSLLSLFDRISIVDLAGAERSNKSGASGTRMTEANNINKDLFTLGRCIRSMMDNQSKRSAIVITVL